MRRKRKRFTKRKRRLRILGNDRGLMMLCKDVRRRWAQYGTNRKMALAQPACASCRVGEVEEVDHIEAVGKRPRVFSELGAYAERMFTLEVQGLCIKCHCLKTLEERLRRKDGGA